jgi:DMSO/TMAO reductase YedYZ molybdopterin-dependent catalytic subunit
MDRREFIAQGLWISGAVLFGCRQPEVQKPKASRSEVRDFEGEGDPPMHTLLGAGDEGRRFTDLSAMDPGDPLVPASHFFVRSRAPATLASPSEWNVRIDGLVNRPLDLSFAGLLIDSQPQGVVCLECAGNDPGGRFGMLAAAAWEGIPLQQFLDRIRVEAGVRRSANRILFQGADPGPGHVGKSWVFRTEELGSAFLATGLEGSPLSPDQGGPVRLLVPGYYGCTAIKWVTGISFLAEDAPATRHMREYAGRTHQAGVPQLAREYRPARMGLSAMPIRLEKRIIGMDASWDMLGLTWGGHAAGEDVEIQTGDLQWKDVQVISRRKDAFGWTVWKHGWKPPGPGIYRVTLRPKNTGTVSPRLQSGYYARDCRID